MRTWLRFTLASTFVLASAGVAYRNLLKKSPLRADFASNGETEKRQDLPLIRAILEQVERSKDIPKALGKGPQPAPATDICKECQTPKVQDIRFGQCGASNNYLENDLKRLAQGSGLMSTLLKGGPRRDTVLKATCLKVALSKDSTFSYCGSDGQGPIRRVLRPCLSENYFSLVHNSLEMAYRCLSDFTGARNQMEAAQDARVLFGMGYVESGFHINATNGSGAAGIGQLTSPAIRGMNTYQIPAIRSHLKNKGEQCARIADELLNRQPPMNPGYAQRCERFSLARGNPLLNIIYIYAMMAEAKKSLDQDVFRGSHPKAFRQTPPLELAKIKSALMAWSHNTGVPGLKTPLLALLNSTYRDKPVTNASQFLKELKEAMRRFPHSANAGRIGETSKYWPSIASALEQIETNAGGGSCVNQ